MQRGEIFGLIGADGAGKTTTFQILAGVMEATGGTAEIFGKPARDARSRTGYLTQTFSLYPDLSVTENIRYIGDLRKVPPAEISERGGRYLKMFDMDRFSNRLAAQLSGGMKQKLAFGVRACFRAGRSACWTSRRLASIPFRGANFGTRSLTLPAGPHRADCHSVS